MLVLSRGVDESVCIGPNGEIEVFVISIKRGKVRLGINAPSGVAVHRKEILEYIQMKDQAVTPSEAQELSEFIETQRRSEQ